MTDTPRTDETAKLDWGGLVDQAPEFVRADFARTLERELNEARAKIASLQAKLDGWDRTMSEALNSGDGSYRP